MPSKEELIRRRFLALTREYLQHGTYKTEDLSRVACGIPRIRRKSRSSSNAISYRSWIIYNKKLALLVILPLLYSIIFEYSVVWDFLLRLMQEQRCIVPNNYLVWEFTRPVSNCDFCRGVDSALVFDNITREQFQSYAYTSKPIIVKSAAKHWLASRVFSLQFFRNVYDGVDGAYESIDEECQFLHFRTDFNNLKEVFEMNERRAMNLPGEVPWYIGWKNCHPQVMDILKKFYEPPHFLPEDAEMPNSNYIFLGYEEGADMHLDYIPRLMWQGQIIGSKTWSVAPTPECDDVCGKFSFFVDTGDVVLLDTRLWYHSTHVENRQFSLTVTSEYG